MTDFSDRLHRLCAANRFPQAALILASESTSRLALATDVARHLLCDQASGAPYACGQCSSCIKMTSGRHPDARMVSPEGREISIDQTRALKRWLAIGPHEARHKVAFIDHADLLNPSSGNSLLKLLEEPPPHAFIFLLARAEENLLPTICSRVYVVRIPPTKTGEDRGESYAWRQTLAQWLNHPSTVTSPDLLELTQEIGKEPASLKCFFHDMMDHLRREIQNDNSKRAHLERLFDHVVMLERDILLRYGNAPLAIDGLLLDVFRP